MKTILALVAALILSACGNDASKGLDGTYVNTLTGWVYTFQKNGTFIQEFKDGKTSKPLKYSISGDKVTVEGFQKPTMTILDNGNVATPAGMLEKKK